MGGAATVAGAESVALHPAVPNARSNDFETESESESRVGMQFHIQHSDELTTSEGQLVYELGNCLGNQT
jgi:hypothetical protein